MKLIDLSHKLVNGMPVFEGDPTFEVRQIATIKNDKFTDHKITMGMHNGTHIDAPYHVIEGGKRITDYPADQFMGRGVLIDVRKVSKITSTLLRNKKLKKGDIVVLFSGWDMKFSTAAYYKKHPVIDETFAMALVKAGVKMVGMDFPGPDEAPFPIHRLLLSHDVLILENLTCLEKLLKAKKFEIMAFPLKLDTDGCPLRAVAKVG